MLTATRPTADVFFDRKGLRVMSRNTAFIAEKTANALLVVANVGVAARVFGGGVAELTGRRMFGDLRVGGRRGAVPTGSNSNPI